MSAAEEYLAAIEARVNAATEPTGGRRGWLVEDSGWRAGIYTGVLDGESRDVGFMDELADAEFVASARQDVPALVAAIRAVLTRHWDDGKGYCGECFTRYWPCDDVRAIESALGGTP